MIIVAVKLTLVATSFDLL